MSFSDDHASPAAPFSGDNTGEIFEAPDMVLQSPTTNERVVDTQSGFLVVVKRIEDRQALSVRRRIGTPPSSSVVLTPDESLKLSRVLSGTPVPERTAGRVSGSADDEWATPFASLDTASPTSELAALASSMGLASPRRASAKGLKTLKGTHVALVGGACFVFLVGGVIGYVLEHTSSKPQPKPVAQAASDPLSTFAVDIFVRRFVGNMLDFNPGTYRVSQIRAMSTMAPALVDGYWKDTSFPLSEKQLNELPQGTTVMITKVVQKRVNAKTADVDLYAQMMSEGTKVGTPVHLALRVGLDSDDELRVLSQKDLTAGTHGP